MGLKAGMGDEEPNQSYEFWGHDDGECSRRHMSLGGMMMGAAQEPKKTAETLNQRLAVAMLTCRCSF